MKGKFDLNANPLSFDYKVIKGNEDYIIDATGKVYSLKTEKLKELKQNFTSKGRTTVSLYKNVGGYNRLQTQYVDKLMLENWTSISKKCDVVHLNGDNADNSIKNLSWEDEVQNFKYKEDQKPYKGNFVVVAYNEKGEELGVFKSQTAAANFFKVTPSSVNRVVKGYNKSIKGGITFKSVERDDTVKEDKVEVPSAKPAEKETKCCQEISKITKEEPKEAQVEKVEEKVIEPKAIDATDRLYNNGIDFITSLYQNKLKVDSFEEYESIRLKIKELRKLLKQVTCYKFKKIMRDKFRK